MSEGVVPIRLLPRQAKADKRNHRGTCVGKIVKSIGSNGDGAGNSACNELAEEQQNIQADAAKTAERTILTAHGRILHIVPVTDKQSGEKFCHRNKAPLLGKTIWFIIAQNKGNSTNFFI